MTEELQIFDKQWFVSVLADHALVEIRCDHVTRTDTPVCNCGVVKFSSYMSVQAAKEAWAAHVWEKLAGWDSSEGRLGTDEMGTVKGPPGVPLDG